ncbi:ribonuclease E/G [Swingsia samuiensis]|uniref:RNA-binding protein AU-1/Ribonuclease E/G domain-containing protein n=1 Tax=Swingsia samuiensis TaxID=1293412 RepID=A0A4Y6UII2_9PROT|nr:ribonuclease E/G [Swingsia samuiensis]QDH16874.1 hypothetical protein E3D00_04300 [Swingsia samuiensis]
MIEIRAACSPGELRIAAIENDTFLYAGLWRLGQPDGFDDWHIVRIQTIAPALGGAFVTLFNGQSGFLSSRKLMTEGALVSARVTRSAQNGKGLRLRPAEDPPSSFHEPALIQHGMSPLEEVANRFQDATIFVDDAAIAARLPLHLRPRIKTCLNAFDSTIETEFDELGSNTVDLGLMTASIFPTPALVAIDLDSHKNPDFKSNVSSFAPLSRQIALRNLSGTLLIDPAGVKTRKRSALVSFLQDAMKDDPLKPNVLGVTPSGLLEITRPRKRPPLHELLTSPHGQALNILRHILRENRSGTKLTASIPLITALENDPLALKDFISRRASPIELAINPNAAPTEWRLS